MIKRLEKILKALAYKSRLRIINMLQDKPLCVCEITEVLGLSQSTVSGHLRVLRDADLLEDSKDGLWVEYRLVNKGIINKQLFMIIMKTLDGDADMKLDREQAKLADREVLCKK